MEPCTKKKHVSSKQKLMLLYMILLVCYKTSACNCFHSLCMLACLFYDSYEHFPSSLQSCQANILHHFEGFEKKILACAQLSCSPQKKSGRERLCYGGINRVPWRVVSPECLGNDLIGVHKNYFNLFYIIPRLCFDWLKF